MKNTNIKTKSALLICLAGLAILFSPGCKKDANNSQKTSTAVTGPYLYIGGKGAYWKISLSAANPALVVNTLKNGGAISSLITSGKDVYIAAQTAGYYKNGVFVPVTNASGIEYLALSDTTVVATGFDNTGQIGYWEYNSEISINIANIALGITSPTPGARGAIAIALSGIAVSGINVYLSGGMNFTAQPTPPDTAPTGNYDILWSNGAPQYFGPAQGQVQVDNSAGLSGGYTTAGVAVIGNDVYVAGVVPDYSFDGGYWKNGTFNSINNGAFHPLAILPLGNDLYIPGYTYTGTGSTYSIQGAYWKNGTLISFPLAVGGINSVAVNGTDIYLLGIDSNNNYVVWKNGLVFETLGSAAVLSVNCMAIGN
jgi:hypothetical protein